MEKRKKRKKEVLSFIIDSCYGRQWGIEDLKEIIC